METDETIQLEVRAILLPRQRLKFSTTSSKYDSYLSGTYKTAKRKLIELNYPEIIHNCQPTITFLFIELHFLLRSLIRYITVTSS